VSGYFGPDADLLERAGQIINQCLISAPNEH
jgi:hypothetical protein